MKRLPASAPGARPRWKIWLPILLALLALDAGFDGFFWSIPRIRKPPEFRFSQAEWGYQIAVERRRALEPKAEGAARVLAFGSSVVGSLDPRQVESLLRARRASPRAEVRRLALAGIEPSEFLLLFQSEATLRPDVAVILFNPVDFLFPPGDGGLNPILLYAIPPVALWRAKHDHLGPRDQLELGLAQASRLFRYRRQIRVCLRDHLRAGLRWLIRPAPPGTYGVYADGYTERRFRVELPRGAPSRFEYFVDPEWISQRGRVELAFRSDGQPLATRTESEPGWKSVELELPQKPARVEVSADGPWNPRAGGNSDDLRLLGVKLKHPPAGDAVAGAGPYGYPLLDEREVEPLLRIGDRRGSEADRAWDERLKAKTHSARRMRRSRDARLALRDQSFVPGDEYVALRALVQLLRARGARVLLISTPDNPRFIGDFAGSTWYRGYLEFLGSIASESGAEFQDLGDALPSEDFNDGHHPNYVGALKLGPRYAAMIEPLLPDAPPPR